MLVSPKSKKKGASRTVGWLVMPSMPSVKKYVVNVQKYAPLYDANLVTAILVNF